MANLFNLKGGKLFSFVGKLAEGGVTAEMAEEIDRDPALVAMIVEALKKHPRFTLIHGLFTKPEDQIKRVRELRLERGWGIPDAWLMEAEKSVPKWPDDRLVVATLVPYLGDEKDGLNGVERTFQELWAVAAKAQEKSWRWDGYDKAGPDRLRLLKGIEHKPGLRWEVIDVGCNRGKKPVDVRHPERSPSAGILASAALHPEWVRAMDGENVPYVWAPGYEVCFSGENPWQDVPDLRFNRFDREIQLGEYWYDSGSSRWAVPSFVRE
jgi:hypothetical protein